MRILVGLIFLLCLSFCGARSRRYGQNKPFVSCDIYFKYLLDGFGTIGYLSIPPPPVGQELRVVAVLTSKNKLPIENPGSIELFETPQTTLQRIIDGKNVKYVIKLEHSPSIPKLNKIFYNDKLFCNGTTVKGIVGTNILLEHKLLTKQVGGQAADRLQNQSKEDVYQKHQIEFREYPFSKALL